MCVYSVRVHVRMCVCVCVCVHMCVCACMHAGTHTEDRGAWRCLVMDTLSNVNECMATQEKERKAVMKKRREDAVQSESVALKCVMTGCGFVGLSRAGLLNHVCRRHGRLARLKEKRPFCEQNTCKQ